MICYINRSTVDYDVRLKKYIQACKATHTPYFVIGWDRMLNAKYVDEHEHQMKAYCPYGQGKNSCFPYDGSFMYGIILSKISKSIR